MPEATAARDANTRKAGVLTVRDQAIRKQCMVNLAESLRIEIAWGTQHSDEVLLLAGRLNYLLNN